MRSKAAISHLAYCGSYSFLLSFLALAQTFILNAPANAAAVQADNTLLTKANAFAAKENFAAAEAAYRQFLKIHPDDSIGNQMFGRVLALQGNYQEALRLYKTSLKSNKKNASVMNDIGVVLSICGDSQLGARFLHQATATLQRYTGAYNNLGVTLSQLGAYKQATQAFSSSLALQPRNQAIAKLKAKAEARLKESKDFDFGTPVSYADIPDNISIVLTAPEPDEKAPINDSTVATKIDVPVKAPDAKTEEKKWLEENQATFLDLSGKGLSVVYVSGAGNVQVDDDIESADDLKEIDLSNGKHVQVSGDVTIDISGAGEIELGKYKLSADDENCNCSFNAETGELSCYSGQFHVSNWKSVSATRTGSAIDLTAENCKNVYGQDDTKIEARNCQEVTLVGKAHGTANGCDKLILNDDSRVIADDCKSVVAMSNSKAKVSNCGELKQMDRAKIEKIEKE